MSQNKFIITKDADLANKLSAYYKLISKSCDGTTWVFENIPIKDHFDFSNINGKVAFSNKLLF
jgi:hypothetical protein